METTFTSLTTTNINPDGVLSVALKVGQGGTGCCCCTAHCICHERASLGPIVNVNMVSTHGYTPT